MDIKDEDTILKLAALGWDGKKNPFLFLQKEYNIVWSLTPKNRDTWNLIIRQEYELDNKIKFTISSNQLSKVTYSVILNKILEFFHTENGKVIRPLFSNWKNYWKKEWT